MKKSWKRGLALSIASLTLLSVLGQNALAAGVNQSDAVKFQSVQLLSGSEESTVATTNSGTCGEALTWSLENGVLTIEGTGAMTNYGNASDRPWSECLSDIVSIVVKDEVTSIGVNAFLNCTSLREVYIGDGVTAIGEWAFASCVALETVELGKSVVSIGKHGR